jgi:hypothetical protein
MARLESLKLRERYELLAAFTSEAVKQTVVRRPS